jgi:hypothetical protein
MSPFSHHISYATLGYENPLEYSKIINYLYHILF